ncbi:CGBP1 protein, partial [Polyodon spathula]|nr:CGBP1 protein [Polyodon spathula]
MHVPKKAKNVSAADHVKQCPAGVLYSDAGKLFYTSCNITVHHYRESAVDSHLDSSIHHKIKAEIQSSTETALLAKKQKDLTEAFVRANIPLEKLDNQKLCTFFRLSVANSGVIPSSAQLRHEYLYKVVEYHKQEIMELVKQCGCLSVVTVESTDAQDQYVLHIAFVLQDVKGEHASDALELKLSLQIDFTYRLLITTPFHKLL